MTDNKSARKPAHEALIDYLKHLVEMGGLAEPKSGGELQYRELYALPGLEDRINSVVIPNGKGEAREIADEIYMLVVNLGNNAISDEVGGHLLSAATKLAADYLDRQDDESQPAIEPVDLSDLAGSGHGPV